MNTSTIETAAATGRITHPSLASVAAPAGAFIAGQHGGASRVAVTARIPVWLSQRVRDLKATALLFRRYAAKARVAAERRSHEHNARACRRHAAASLIAYRRGARFPDTVHREACRIQQLTRAESRDTATAAMGGAS
jgi:hypothetical protein